MTDSTEYTGPERRTEMRVWRDTVNQRLDNGAATMKALQADMAENTQATMKIQQYTSELVSLLNSFKGAFKVFDMLGRAAKPLSYIAMALTAIWGLFTAIKGGGPPK
jgi:hypothetical protein